MGEFLDKTIASQENKDTNKSLKFILERAKELEPDILEKYKDFHENPELGGEEFETARKIEEYLNGLGIEIVGKGIGSAGTLGRGASIVARIRGNESGPTIALRADMDALPMAENEENYPRSKKEGVMHGCGHDTHTTALLGTAKILKEMAERGELEGNALLIFQSSEEKAHQKESGAVQVVKFLEEQGLRKDIDAFLGLHVFSELERGQVQLKDGTQLASSGEIDITLRAPGGHIINIYETPSLHRIFSKLTAKLEEKFRPLYESEQALVGSARTAYEGTGYNVLPAEGKSTWVVRVTSPDYKEVSSKIAQDIKEAVDEIIKEEKDYDKVEVEIERRPGYRPVVHRDSELVGVAQESAKEVIDNYSQIKKIVMGGEDFSFYLEKFRGRQIPGVFVMIGAANPEKGYPKVSHHTGKFKIDPEAIKDLTALYSNFTLNAINHFKNKGK